MNNPALKVTLESTNPRWNDAETHPYASLEEAVAGTTAQLEEEIAGADFYDDGTEEALRREFIAKIQDPKTFEKLAPGKPLVMEYGVPDYEPVRATFELVS